MIDCGAGTIPGFYGCHIFRKMVLGVSFSDYYPLIYDGENEILPEPEIIGILDYFDIDHADFMKGCPNPKVDGDTSGPRHS